MNMGSECVGVDPSEIPVPEDAPSPEDEAPQSQPTARTQSQTPVSKPKAASATPPAAPATDLPPLSTEAQASLLNRALGHLTVGFALLHELKANFENKPGPGK